MYSTVYSHFLSSKKERSDRWIQRNFQLLEIQVRQVRFGLLPSPLSNILDERFVYSFL